MPKESDGADREDEPLSQMPGVSGQNEASEVAGDEGHAPAPAPTQADQPADKGDQPKHEVLSEVGKIDERSSDPKLQPEPDRSREQEPSTTPARTQPFGILVKEEIR